MAEDTDTKPRRDRPGQVMVYYGQGKGKTTAALGLALRALGRGWRVCMLQFTKSGEWPPGKAVAENVSARRLEPDFELIPVGLGFVNILGDPYPYEEHLQAAQRGLALAREKLDSRQYELVILDEVIGVVAQKMLDIEEVMRLIADRPHGVHLLLTGHDDRLEFIQRFVDVADLVSEMVKVKHPFDQGHQARRGLDY